MSGFLVSQVLGRLLVLGLEDLELCPQLAELVVALLELVLGLPELLFQVSIVAFECSIFSVEIFVVAFKRNCTIPIVILHGEWCLLTLERRASSKVDDNFFVGAAASAHRANRPHPALASGGAGNTSELRERAAPAPLSPVGRGLDGISIPKEKEEPSPNFKGFGML
ncbi:hypothetical protein P3342_000708 [Pyrenophora teres f. teres]|nr:hypothetical protein P3342_000708 [Pyrenophora teres f. teres]